MFNEDYLGITNPFDNSDDYESIHEDMCTVAFEEPEDDTVSDSDDYSDAVEEDCLDLSETAALAEWEPKPSDNAYKKRLTNQAYRYIDKKFAPVPVSSGGKKPLGMNWPERRITKEEVADAFNDDSNIGLILGAASNGLVDVDLDCDEAIKIASHFLPETGMKCGRPAAPDSHHFYICPAIEAKQFRDADAGDHDPMILEIRSNRSMTVVPPSRTLVDKHGDPDGETEERTWTTDDLNPATVSRDELFPALCTIASIVLISRSWKPGKRNETAMALAGMLAHGGIPLEQAKRMVTAVCGITNDAAQEDRIAAVKRTYDKYDNEQEVKGFPALCELIGNKRAEKIKEWLGIRNVPGEATNSLNNDTELAEWMEANISEWLENDPPPKDWIINGILQSNIVVGLNAPGGTGKSFLTLMIAMSVATGKAILPALTPAAPMPVIALLAEDPAEETWRRLKNICEYAKFNVKEIALLKKNLTLYPNYSEPLLVPGEKGAKKTARYYWLKSRIEQKRPRLLILDPKSRMSNLDENNNSDTTQFLAAIEALVHPVNGSAIVTHHVSKGMHDKMNTNAPRGASAFADGCRGSWQMAKVSGNDTLHPGVEGKFVKLEVVDSNYTETSEAPIILRHQPEFDGAFEQYDSRTIERKKFDAALQTLVTQLSIHGQISVSDLINRRDDTAKEICDAIKSKSGFSSAHIEKLIDSGIEKNLLRVETIQSKSAGRSKTVVMAVSSHN